MTLSRGRLAEVVDYDIATGQFTWRSRQDPQWNGLRAGKVAGRLAWNGYRLITIDYTNYREHHLAWLWVHGEMPQGDIDHIDGDRANNRIGNLRLATRSQNLANKWDRRRNVSGFKGVSASGRKSKPWAAHIKVNGRSAFLGRYETPEAAHAAYAAKAVSVFGEYAKLS